MPATSHRRKPPDRGQGQLWPFVSCALHLAPDKASLGHLFLARYTMSKPAFGCGGQDLNLRPSGYEPDELPGCSTPRQMYRRRQKRQSRRNIDKMPAIRPAIRHAAAHVTDASLHMPNGTPHMPIGTSYLVHYASHLTHCAPHLAIVRHILRMAVLCTYQMALQRVTNTTGKMALRVSRIRPENGAASRMRLCNALKAIAR